MSNLWLLTQMRQLGRPKYSDLDDNIFWKLAKELTDKKNFQLTKLLAIGRNFSSRSGNPACRASTRSATRMTSEPVPTVWAPRRSFGQLSRTLPVEQKIGSSLSRSQMLLAQPTPTLGSSIVPGLFQHRSCLPRCQHLLISQRGRATKVRAEEQKAGRARQKNKGTAQRASQWKQESIWAMCGTNISRVLKC